jgi:hypothetical protein
LQWGGRVIWYICYDHQQIFRTKGMYNAHQLELHNSADMI